jgi:hypothetical protein
MASPGRRFRSRRHRSVLFQLWLEKVEVKLRFFDSDEWEAGCARDLRVQ